MLVTSALLCLAMNIYHEARGQPILGQYAVALVTMNRAKDREKVCSTVFAPMQFSWTNGTARKTKGGWLIAPSLKPKEDHAWWVANRIALMTLEGRMIDITKGASHYHNLSVKPDWTFGRKPVHRLGSHIFYRLS